MKNTRNRFLLLLIFFILVGFIRFQVKNDNKLIEGVWIVAASNDGENFYVKKTDSIMTFEEALRAKDMFRFMCENQKFKFSKDGEYTQFMLDSAMYTMKFNFFSAKKMLVVEGKNSLKKIKIDTLNCFLERDTLNLNFPVGYQKLFFKLIKN